MWCALDWPADFLSRLVFRSIDRGHGGHGFTRETVLFEATQGVKKHQEVRGAGRTCRHVEGERSGRSEVHRDRYSGEMSRNCTVFTVDVQLNNHWSDDLSGIDITG